MVFLGKWRLHALILVAAVLGVAVWFVGTGWIGLPRKSAARSCRAATRASAEREKAECAADRKRLAPLRGVALFEVLLDSAQPDLARIIAVARQQGEAAALRELRKRHLALPLPPFLRPLPEWSSTLKERAIADDVIEKGYRTELHPAFPVKPPIDWTADPFDDRSFRFDLHSWKFLDSPLRLSRAKDGAFYARYARDVALDWSRHHLDGTASSDFAWYDMAVGARAGMLALILDGALRDPSVGDEELILLLKAASAHCTELMNPQILATQSNHGLIQMGGLLALCATLPELREAGAGRKYAERTLTELAEAQFTSEAIHKEHSPGYHIMVTTYLGRLIRTGWLSGNAELNSLYARAAWNAIWMAHPDGRMANQGDTLLAVVEDRLAYPDDPQIDYVLSEGERGTKPPMTYQVFKRSGCAVFRSAWEGRPWKSASYLFFTAAFHSPTHRHSDDFSFEWSELGTRLVQDSGAFAYWQDDPRRRYVLSTRAHNTVEIDERDFSRSARDVFGSAITGGGQSDGLYYVQADLRHVPYFNTEHRRIVVFDPGKWLLVIDQLRSPEEHTYTQWFHFDPSLHMTAEGEGAASPIGDTGSRLLVWPLAASPGQSMEIIRGQERPRLQGWVSLARAALIPNDAVGFTQKAKDATFVTLLHIGKPNARVAPTSVTIDPTLDGYTVRWLVDGKPEGFLYNAREGTRSLRRTE